MQQSVIEAIQRRFSCRRHLDQALETDTQIQLQDFLRNLRTGPFGSNSRFILIAATEQDRQSLKGVGTYGVIRNAQGYIVGAMGPGEKNLEDFGYLLEKAVLFATGLDLGTCWLGGSFTKGGFAGKIGAVPPETVPAVVSVGYPADRNRLADLIRQRTDGAFRLPAAQLFFEEQFGQPISPDSPGHYATVLDMVRWGPSASNKQPWRILRAGGNWHFYLRRTPGYGRDSWLGRLIGVADVQRLDMGIAMCHFELAATELGEKGTWAVCEPAVEKPDKFTEYVASWLVPPGKPIPVD